MKFLLTMGLAGALVLPALALAQQDRTRQNDQDEPGNVADAIRFQKAEDAAAARQARIEAAREREAHSADRVMTKTRVKAKTSRTETTRRVPPPQPAH